MGRPLPLFRLTCVLSDTVMVKNGTVMVESYTVMAEIDTFVK
jgi:hypothetical protein